MMPQLAIQIALHVLIVIFGEVLDYVLGVLLAQLVHKEHGILGRLSRTNVLHGQVLVGIKGLIVLQLFVHALEVLSTDQEVAELGSTRQRDLTLAVMGFLFVRGFEAIDLQRMLLEDFPSLELDLVIHSNQSFTRPTDGFDGIDTGNEQQDKA